MVRTTFIIALLLCAALTIALPVRRNNLVTSETLAPRTDFIWDEVRSLDDFEFQDLVQRGPKKVVQKVMAKVQGVGAKLSPFRWSEKRKQQQRQKAMMEGLVREHAHTVAWQASVREKESAQGAQYHSARVAQKKEKKEAMQDATSRRKTWSPGQTNGLPGRLGFGR